MSAVKYDLVVIGSGPAGQRAAVAAAKMGKRVAVVEAREVVGGVCVNTGTIQMCIRDRCSDAGGGSHHGEDRSGYPDGLRKNGVAGPPLG